MNTGKCNVMVGRSGGKMILNFGKWPCGVCGKGVHAICLVHIMYKMDTQVVQWCMW